jgi:SulP family sulfate permease
MQMDMGKQLDFNHELITVGLANAVSGLSGGFTGSYIFSTTVFTYRTGARPQRVQR